MRERVERDHTTPDGDRPGPAEGIAVIGLSCLLPGAAGPERFWDLLRAGGDAVTEVPDGRWESVSGDPAVVAGPSGGARFGGFLDSVADFDAGFFGISPREAAATDPQQRVVLELAWEALEHARIVPAALRGSRTGVYMGSLREDYTALMHSRGAAGVNPHLNTGSHRGLIANRVSYFLGLRGPSALVDTAQSSSLVAVHAACQALRAGEVDLALAGGVNLNLVAEGALGAEEFGGLSPTGKVRAFDADADGYVRGEGAAVLVLKPLARATADGDRVLAVILGGAVNNDGATEGLTVPSARAQAEVIRAAVARSGLSPADVGYVELHGTGTPVGDPVEAAALGSAYGAVARPEPLQVGSVKTNIGHLEGAAGVAGLVKVVLSLANGELPASLNFTKPNPAIPLDELNLAVRTEHGPWPGGDRPVAGVSSFGMGGTNCHLVVSAAPAAEPAAPVAEADSPALVAVSGRDRAALRAQAAGLRAALAADPDLTPADLGRSTLTTRQALRHRAALVVDDRAALAAALDAVAEGLPDANARTGTAVEGGLAVVFTGQGAQRVGMGEELAAAFPVFAEARDRAHAEFDRLLPRPLAEVLHDAEALDRTEYTQPALFAYETALFALLSSWGLRPDAVAGHSIGEITAAHVAGALSLADACALVAARGRLMQALPGGGAMAAVEATAAEVAPLLAEHGVDLAAVNGPRSVVVSGDESGVEAVASAVSGWGRRTKRLAVSHAFHSRHLDPVLDGFRAVLSAITFTEPALPVVSSVTGEVADVCSVDYWVGQARSAVDFAAAVRGLEDRGVRTVLEVGPAAACAPMVVESAVAEGTGAVATAAPGQSEPGALRLALAGLFVRGVDLDWDAAHPEGRVVDLPRYAFQRSRHWVEPHQHTPEHPTTAMDVTAPAAITTADRGEVSRLVTAHVHAILGTSGVLEADLPFRELGFTSLTSVRLRDALADATGLALPGGVLFDHPTPRRLTDHLAAELAGGALTTVDEQDQAHDGEPIAVVGMACRYPGGVTSPEDLWELVFEGRDAIGGFPGDRGWPHGTEAVGGFLHDAGEFDAAFFGLSPREALAMDPQQRLVLATAWEAVERARIAPGSLRGTRTGVFVGATAGDYGPRMHEAPDEVAGHVLTGSAASVASGRVAYHLGLAGPALTVDTACSSSLVAVHLAMRSLRAGETSLALAGGVAVMSAPGMFVEFARQHGLAADGRCKPFAAAADGTSWAEGAGVLVLERLSDARRNGRQVLAVLRGSAINSDGASNGLTAPSGPAQQRVIRSALADAGLSASDVDVLEAHGTGTALGDPIEAQALLATYGADREVPALLGSLKSNIGHTQAAAGVGGIIKLVGALRHGVVPATLHVDEPSPHVDWTAGAVELAVAGARWPETGRVRRAAVSSFGISGTNAHVIVEQAVEPAEETSVDDGRLTPWVVSGVDAEGLRAQAAAVADWAQDAPAAVADIGFALTTTRDALRHRAVVLGRTRDELVAGLRSVAEGAGPTGVADGGATAVLFTGQGAQRAGMGDDLAAAHPVFAAALDEACAAFDGLLPRPLREVMAAEDDPELHQTRYTQPALFAYETALFRLAEHHGLVPDALAGHSIGELVAAHVSGALALADAAALVAARGELAQSAPAGGAMVAIGATEDEVVPTLPADGSVVVAAVNGPRSVVVAGDPGPAERVGAHWRAEGRPVKALRVSHAFHSPHLDGVLDEFREVAARVAFGTPRVPVVSTRTGRVLTAREIADPDHWVGQLRGAVRFLDAVRALEELGATAFVEVGPDSALTAMAAESVTAPGAVALALVRSGRPESTAFAEGIVKAHALGRTRDLSALLPGARPVDVPLSVLRGTRFWLAPSTGGDATALGLDAAAHPLLGGAVEVADGGGVVLTGSLSTATQPWLAGHRVRGRLLVPATALLDMAVAAADRVGAPGVAELTMTAPLVLPDDAAVRVQVRVDADGRIGVHARQDGGTWTACATGRVETAEAAVPATMAAWPPPGAEPVDIADAYPRLAGLGYEYSGVFVGLRAAWRTEDGVHAEVELSGADPGGFGVHPALLDAALHPLVLDAAGADGTVRLPFSWTGVSLHATGATRLRVSLVRADDGVSLLAADQTGAPVCHAESLLLRAATPDTATAPVFTVAWTRVPAATAEPVSTAVVGDGLDSVADADVAVLLAGSGAGPDGAHEVAAAVLGTVRDWLADDRFDGRRLVVVTDGAVSAAPGEDVPALAQAPVWGLVRAAQTEHPDRLVLLDLGGAALADVLDAALASGEPQLAARDGELLAPRLGRVSGAATGSARPLDPEGTVLVTGGTSGLGALVARLLVTEHGARTLLLASRRGADTPGAAELVAELTGLGARVRVAAADAADPVAVRELVASVEPEHPLTAVVHTAGVLDDATVAALDADRLAAVLRPKVDAAWHLHEATEDADLAAFVLFSSISGLLGTAGQANYAAANTYLDALAAHRHARGLAATSAAWGLWDGSTGMGATLEQADVARWAKVGVEPISPALGAELFAAVLAAADPLTVPVAFDPARCAVDPVPAPLRGLVRRRRRSAAAQADSGWATRVRALDDDARRAAVLDAVLGQTATALGHADARGIDPAQAFKELGFDSLTGVELRNSLSAATGVKLSATAVFDHPSPRALSEHLLTRLGGEAAPARAATRAKRTDDDPIVIVGMACRYPGGVADPDGLWRLVDEGVDAIGGFPVNRGWDLDALYDPDPGKVGASYTDQGGFLHDADLFDRGFFGMSPREATATDPQQRLLLETAWETFENAAIDPAALRGSNTGVYVGVMYDDYASRLATVPEEYEGFLLAGNTSSVISGRLAYNYGLEGPTMTVDTACSSSLVAMHLAAQALRRGECDLAVAGGVTVMAGPNTFVEFSRQRGLSADGRCKSFAASADGTGWSEGVGLLLVERLSDARRNGHRVLAVLRGSAVNSDGASNGLTAPNGPAQERVIHAALADAGLTPSDVDAVEAHGTGTTLGDPIEAQALLATYGAVDREHPLLLGSLKSNIGHAQAAAGVGGVIKMVMAMRHGVLPRSLHLDAPSPHVDWADGAVELLRDPVPWPAADRPRRAGVSSFGISGTNAHVVLEQPEPEAVSPAPAAVPAPPWLLSAADPAALRAQAARLADFAEGAEATPAEIAAALADRPVLRSRVAVTGADRAELVAGLRAVAAGEVEAADERPAGKVAFLFTGQGSQRPGMGRELYESVPVFAEAFDAVCAHLDPVLDRPVRSVLFAEPETADAALLDQTAYTQAVLFAVEVALYRTVEHLGVRPDFLLGHSVGEVVAAHVAGVLGLADACALVATRGRLMQAARDDGAMLAVAAPEAEVLAELAELPPGLAVAGVNGPNATVVSGDAAAVDAAAGRWRARGLRVKRLPVSHAFHSPHMDGVVAEFEAAIAGLDWREPTIPVVSNTTGAFATPEQLASPGYWARHIREAVRFLDGVRLLADAGVADWLELGPDGVLTALVSDSVDAASAAPVLRSGKAEALTLAAAVGGLWARGRAADRRELFGTTARIDLPPYAFQRQRYWLEDTATRGAGRYGLGEPGHPLLGAAVEVAETGTTVYTGRVSPSRQRWLADHAVAGRVLLPGAALVELVARAAADDGRTPADLVLAEPLVLESGARTLQVVVGPVEDDGSRPVAVHSRAEAEERWTTHATGSLRSGAPAAPDTSALAQWPPALPEVDLTGAYERAEGHGFAYGPAFRGLRRAWAGDGEVFAEVELAADDPRFLVHPALLDAALHPLVPDVVDSGVAAVLPFSWHDFAVHATGARSLRVRLAVRRSEHGATAELVATDGDGAPVVSVGELVLRPWTASGAAPDGLHAPRWVELPLGPAAGADPMPVLGETWSDLADLLCAVDSGMALPGTVVYPVAAGEGPVHERALAVATEVAGVLRTWLTDDRLADTRLVVRTEGAEADPALAGVWGLVRSAQAEHPDRLVLADVEGGSSPLLGAALATGEPQLAVAGGRVRVPRVERAGAGSAEVDWSAGTVLITGGTGTLGAELARHLAREHGARSLVLLSRRGQDAPGAAALVAELAGLGAGARVVACDAADRDSLAAVLAGIDDLAAVVHTAGVLDDAVLTSMRPEQLAAVLRPKVDAAWHLHELTEHLPLRAFVLYSSIAGWLGTAGQAAYAAANTVLDGIARHRADLGLPATSLAWGLWAQGSEITGALSEVDVRRLAAIGLVPLATDEAMALFDAALRTTAPALAVSGLDTRSAAPERLPAVLRKAPGRRARPAAAAASAAAPEAGLAERLAAMTPEQAGKRLAALVREEVAAVLGHSGGGGGEVDEVTDGSAFRSLGFDSLTAVELRNRLAKATGLKLSSTVVFDHPTAGDLAAHLAERVAEQAAPARAGTPSLTAALAQLADAVRATPLDAESADALRALLRAAPEDTATSGVDDLVEATDDELFALVDGTD
ncbi:SDR family NAD(P)-dependent oxidoreductase [Actinokineospora sp. G85]|uniref:SDR family NAD(P)-dependent oxidoreductase n=1 Tax=Actinokineospora sp. G85 TaxID=3406626 RepID=UPI003C7670F1